VHAEDLVVDHSREREEVEHVGEVRPDMRRPVLAHALGVEAVRLRTVYQQQAQSEHSRALRT
jgi:hypothetical protein